MFAARRRRITCVPRSIRRPPKRSMDGSEQARIVRPREITRLGATAANEAGRPYRRRAARPGIKPDPPSRSSSAARAPCSPCRCCKDDELVGVIVIYRQEVRPFTDKQIELVDDLRRPGRHRHRERAPAQRAARAHRRSHRVAAAADRDRRRAQGHQPLAVRSCSRSCKASSTPRRASAAPTRRSSSVSTDGLYRFAAGYSLDPKYIEIEKATLIAARPRHRRRPARAMDKQVVRIDDALADPRLRGKGRTPRSATCAR